MENHPWLYITVTPTWPEKELLSTEDLGHRAWRGGLHIHPGVQGGFLHLIDFVHRGVINQAVQNRPSRQETRGC